jgi:hypothetical protein
MLMASCLDLIFHDALHAGRSVLWLQDDEPDGDFDDENDDDDEDGEDDEDDEEDGEDEEVWQVAFP